MAVALFGATAAFGQSGLFKIDLSTRSVSDPYALADAAYNQYEQNLWNLSYLNRQERISRGLQKASTPYIAPALIRFVKNGYIMPTGGRTRGTGITLSIDSSFGSTRATFLQQIYDAAKPYIELYFGDAALSGTVNVVNADATIGDRQAITGGYYLPNNGSGGREIRMPFNASLEVTAASFIHCLLLAYLPDPAYGYDAYLEGLVRAATAKIVRIPAATQTAGSGTLSQAAFEQLLAQTYEIGPYYDWANQKSLGGPQFIAPNLLNVGITQGTRGGLFFQRYQMAGSAWAKVLTEHPTFIKDFNLLFRANTGTANNAAQLEALASQALGSGTVEGDTFANWVRKQYVLDTRLTVGTKLHSLITPITDGLSSGSSSNPDYGVFNIEATWFSTDASGNETLLSATAYPIFWTTDYQRTRATSQEDKMDIAGSYGSVVPNFPNRGDSIPYRVAIDLPVQDRIVRQYVPVGAIATATQQADQASDFYGTVTGFAVPSGGSLLIRLPIGASSVDVPVTNYAFGTKIGTTEWLGARTQTMSVISRDSNGIETVLYTRVVDKGPGALGVQLGNEPVVNAQFANSLNAGIQMVGFTGDPLYSGLEDILGLGSSNFLAARYNPGKTTYDLYPKSGAVTGGQGYFIRVPVGGNPIWKARVESGTAVSVALRPGWNMITCPLGLDTSFSNVDVVHAADFPTPYISASGNDGSDASGALLGKDVFVFVPGAPDAVTGVPEGGSFVPATSFEPGQAYFIRCRSAEGVTLLFRPDSASSFHRTATVAPPKISHLLEVQVSRTGESSFARVGQATGATNGFDPKFDSNLPPSIGGLQLAVQNGELRFQDVKSVGATVTNRVIASGCVVGKKYTIIFQTKAGRANQIQITDRQTGKTQSYGGATGSFVFTASSTTMSFDLTVRGARA